MTIFTPSSLPAHAPRNARYGRPTKCRSFLGGVVWEWFDVEGRSLGQSNAVPVNTHGESTRPGGYVEPGEVKLSELRLRKLRFEERIRDRFGKDPVVANDGYLYTPYILFDASASAAIEADPELAEIRKEENGGGFRLRELFKN